MKKCFFCPEDNENLLDAHRIIPGKDGGTYIPTNILCICSNCHRRVHAGEIVVDRKYPCTSGKLVVHYFDKGIEYWKEESNFS